MSDPVATRYPQAILVSCEIPWDEEEQLLEEVFRQEVRHILRHFHHLYIFGTAGEGYAVTTAQFQRIVQIFHEETQGNAAHDEAAHDEAVHDDDAHDEAAHDDVHPMVGVIGLSTGTIVERLTLAYETGFRVFQISLPPWSALNDTELMTFFHDVCDSFPDAQFLHYNLPRTGRVLEAPEYRRLVDAIPNLVATKNTAGGMERAAALVQTVPELQHFFGERNFPHGSLYGECSLLSSMGPMVPRKAKALFEAGRTGDVKTLFALQKEFYDLSTALLGPLRHTGYIDGAWDKLLLRLGGFEAMPLRLLSPYQSFTEEEYQARKAFLQQYYSEWLEG